MNICEHLFSNAEIFPDKSAIVFDGRSYSYRDLQQFASSAGNRLREAGVRPGDRVAIMLPNVPAFAVWYFAAVSVGAVAVSVSTRAAAAEVGFITTDCEPKVFVALAGTLELVRAELAPSVTTTVAASPCGTEVDDSPLSPSSATEKFDADPDDAAVILYTSGTTGFPKGATLSHMNVRSNVCAFNHLCGMKTVDRILLAVPLFHCFGQNALLNSALNVGATLILQQRFDLNEAKQLIASEEVTQLYGVPMMFQLFLDSCSVQDLASVNYCFSAAAPLPIQVAKRWHSKFGMPVNEGYGLTETSPFASYNHRDNFVAGSIGTPIDCVEMKIVDSETGIDCPNGELGEIAVRGPNVMLGYWNREEETTAAIRDGWFFSGDIGKRDEAGYFYIVDRVKDMIAVGGLKVFPAEVERVILDHPSVDQVAVVGIPDDVFGEQVVAFVVLSGVTSDPEQSELLSSIQQLSREQLANYKVPRLVVCIDELPRNPSGKVLKTILREYDLTTESEFSSTASTTSDEPVVSSNQLRPASLRRSLQTTFEANRKHVALEFIQQLVKSVSDAEEPLSAEDRFLDAGLDSLAIVELSNQIQVEVGADTDVPATLVFDHPRLTDLADYLVLTLADSSIAVSRKTPEGFGKEASSRSTLRREVEELDEDEALAELMKEIDS